MANKTLSIAIPAYNMADYLEKCLSSIANAKGLSKIDVMVIDDGGTDASLDIAKGFESRHPGSIRAIHKPNGGHGSVINFGIEHAIGRYFKVIDGDDWVDSNALDGLLTVLENADSDIIVSDYNLIDDATGDLIERRHAARNEGDYGHTLPITVLANEEIVKIHSLTVRTELLRANNVKVDEGCFYEDAEFSIYPLAFAKDIHFDKNAVYQYRLGRVGQSMDMERLKRNKDQHMKIMMSLLAFRDEYASMDEDHLHAVDRAIAYYTQNQYQIFLSIGNTSENVEAMKRFDGLLRKSYPSIYNLAEKRSIWLIRKSNYLAFPFGCLVYKAYRAVR